MHWRSPGQTPPQRPQWLLFVWRFTHCPEHSERPGVHTHREPTQWRLKPHAKLFPGVEHPPQFAELLVVSTSQPLLTTRSQLPRPGLQPLIMHVRALQYAVPVLTMHDRPQASQWLASVERFTSHPFDELLSQLP